MFGLLTGYNTLHCGLSLLRKNRDVSVHSTKRNSTVVSTSSEVVVSLRIDEGIAFYFLVGPCGVKHEQWSTRFRLPKPTRGFSNLWINSGMCICSTGFLSI